MNFCYRPCYPPLFLPRLPRTPRKLSLDPSPCTSPAQPRIFFWLVTQYRLNCWNGHPLKTSCSQSGQEERTGTDKYRRKFSLRFSSVFKPGLKTIPPVLAGVWSWHHVVPSPGGVGVLPCMGYIGMCRGEGYGLQAFYSGVGYINQRLWV